MTYLHVNSVTKKSMNEEIQENVRSRWVSEVRYVDAEATVKLIFRSIVIPLITRLEERLLSMK